MHSLKPQVLVGPFVTGEEVSLDQETKGPEDDWSFSWCFAFLSLFCARSLQLKGPEIAAKLKI